MDKKVNQLFADVIKNIYEKSNSETKNIIIEETKKMINDLDGFEEDKNLKRELINAIGINRLNISNSTNKRPIQVIEDLEILESIDFEILISNYVAPVSDKINYLIEKLKNGLYKTVCLKMLIYGKPGTGKTTLVNYISKKVGLPLYYVKASNVLSAFLGDTQKNFDKLNNDIKNIGGNGIVLIDEIDSILGDRITATNDEYKKIIGAFNVMLDSIKTNAIIISITNNVKFIDEAIVRRFNVKLEINRVSKEEFQFALMNKLEQNQIKFEKNILVKIVKLLPTSLEDNLNYAIIDSVVEDNLFLGDNIYFSLVTKIFDYHIDLNNLQQETKNLEKWGFNATDSSKILGLDRRTVKNKIESV